MVRMTTTNLQAHEWSTKLVGSLTWCSCTLSPSDKGQMKDQPPGVVGQTSLLHQIKVNEN